MTTKTETEQLRADFEAWYEKQMGEAPRIAEDMYTPFATACWEAYQAGRAALQSQVKNDTTLFCDLKTDEEKCAFFLSGRGYETGVIAQAIQNDVSMAYHRCAEYKKELETLQSQDREDAERVDFIEASPGWLRVSRLGHRTKQMWACVSPFTDYEHDLFKTAREAIDHARRIEEDVE